MDVSSATDGATGATVLRLSGQLDIDTARVLRGAVERIRADGVTRLVVDLDGLTFCDSMGLSELVLAHRHCTAAGGYVRLAGPRRFLFDTLSVVGVTSAIPVYATVRAACDGDAAGRLEG